MFHLSEKPFQLANCFKFAANNVKPAPFAGGACSAEKLFRFRNTTCVTPVSRRKRGKRASRLRKKRQKKAEGLFAPSA
jgi:hypothetical protein